MSLLSLFTFNTCLFACNLLKFFLSFYHACSYFAVFQSYPFVLFLFLTGVFSCYSYLECSTFVPLECFPFVPIDVSYRGGLTKPCCLYRQNLLTEYAIATCLIYRISLIAIIYELSVTSVNFTARLESETRELGPTNGNCPQGSAGQSK